MMMGIYPLVYVPRLANFCSNQLFSFLSIEKTDRSLGQLWRRWSPFMSMRNAIWSRRSQNTLRCCQRTPFEVWFGREGR